MRDLMHNITNEDLLGKIDVEGPEYFFLEYVDPDSIKDEDLRSYVRTLQLIWKEILMIVDELEEELNGEE